MLDDDHDPSEEQAAKLLEAAQDNFKPKKMPNPERLPE